MRRFAAVFIIACLSAAAPSVFSASGAAEAVQIQRSYVYYPISAASKKELIAALSRNGPYLAQTKQRHPAAVKIDFKDKPELRQKGKYCAAGQAGVLLYAKIYLPEWRQRKTSKNTDLVRFWDMLLKDMKKHEARHISIAHSYALRMEEELRALPKRRNCEEMRRDAAAAVNRLRHNNDVEQAEFDEKEAQRVKKALKKMRQNEQPE